MDGCLKRPPGRRSRVNNYRSGGNYQTTLSVGATVGKSIEGAGLRLEILSVQPFSVSGSVSAHRMQCKGWGWRFGERRRNAILCHLATMIDHDENRDVE
jgi:hypothetical protein